jgi:5'-3' exonuclease
MGVPLLWSKLRRSFSSSVISQRYNYESWKTIECDTLGIDLNAIIHPICQKEYGYGGDDSSILSNSNYTVELPTHNKIYKLVVAKVKEYVRIAKPKQYLICAIDGTAGLSKCNQQRQRRYKSAMTPHPNFNSSHISTGTLFMEECSKYIEKKLPYIFPNLKIIFSGHRCPGEGEHKIIKAIRQIDTQTNIILSPDADIILLGMTLIQRSNATNISVDNILLSVDNNKDQSSSSLGNRNIMMYRPDNRYGDTLMNLNEVLNGLENQVATTNFLNDFIVITSMLGNDFIPNVPSLELHNDGMECLLSVYKEYIETNPPIVKRIRNKNRITQENFHTFISLLAQREESLFTSKVTKNRPMFPDSVLLESVTNANSKQFVNLKDYKELYYERRLENAIPATVAYEYYKGMCFVLSYYTETMPDWNWSYPYHYAPLLHDLSSLTATKEKIKIKFNRTKPLLPLEQLVMVIPSQSKMLVPECFHELLDTADNIRTDQEGKYADWDMKILLPHIDVKDMKEKYTSIVGQLKRTSKQKPEQVLTSEEIIRNSIDHSWLIYKGNKTHIQL